MKSKNIEKIFAKIEDISSEISIVEDSISFWENRMEECFSRCDEIEENQWLPNLDEKISNLRKEMKFILNKVEAEERELDRLDESINKLYKEIISIEV